MINKDYNFLTKPNGPSALLYNGTYYGDSRFTWDFFNHWAVLTVEFAELLTGKNLSSLAGSLELAEAELLKISKISRLYIMNRIPVISRRQLEYRVAKDSDFRDEILQFQLQILETWGGYQSMYRVKDSDNQQTIGRGAIEFIYGTTAFIGRYNWEVGADIFRVGY